MCSIRSAAAANKVWPKASLLFYMRLLTLLKLSLQALFKILKLPINIIKLSWQALFKILKVTTDFIKSSWQALIIIMKVPITLLNELLGTY